jgi:PBP1b-binding outer membrane lipoprotein LpoB
MRMLKQLSFRVSCLALLSFFLVACVTSFPSVNVDPNKNNNETYKQDFKDCKEAYPEAGSGVHIKQWISCMNLKGWK